MQSTNQTISEADYREPTPKLTELLEKLIKLNGSDLHITTNTQPRMRINGDLEPLPDYPILTAAPGTLTLPRQRVRPAKRNRRRLSRYPI